MCTCEKTHVSEGITQLIYSIAKLPVCKLGCLVHVCVCVCVREKDCVSVCVCVCEREREIECKREREKECV